MLDAGCSTLVFREGYLGGEIEKSELEKRENWVGKIVCGF